MKPNSNSQKYIQIDQDGFFHFDGQKLVEQAEGSELLANLACSEGVGNPIKTKFQSHEALVEYYDSPLVIQTVDKAEGKLVLQGQYDYRFEGDWSQLTVDEWDRFHGYRSDGVPFVMSRKAQVQLFELFDEFTDETFTVDGTEYPVGQWLLGDEEALGKDFWEERFATEDTPWDLGDGHPAIKEILPQLKLAKQRILVLGCGAGHDAAHLAEAGHIVTGVDYSPAGIAAAQSKYSGMENLKFLEGDAFNLGEDHHGQYDLIFENTLYCAIDPRDRGRLVDAWKRYLVADGHILGIFFMYDRVGGPPFGSSEWELQSRIEPHFAHRYWTRWRLSPEGRQGIELMVYAQRKAQ